MRPLRRPPRPGHVYEAPKPGVIIFPTTNVPATEENHVVQSVWVGPSLSLLEKICIRSFLKNGHEFHLYTYGTVAGVPEGTIVKDANAIVPEKVVSSFRYLANFSDFFRYTMLMNGGWYVDMDSVCLRPLEFKAPYVFAAAACDDYYKPIINPLYSDGCYIENGYIKVPAGNNIMRHCRDLVEQWKAGDQNYCDPMLIIQKGVQKFNLESYVQPPCVFDPMPFYKLGCVVDPCVSWDLSGAYIVHLIRSGWNVGTHSHAGLVVDNQYDSDCLYEKLKRRYL